MIHLEIEVRKISLSEEDRGLATAVLTRPALEPEFMDLMEAKPGFGDPVEVWIDEGTLIRMITKYSEQLIFRPLDEIRHWFALKDGAYLEPGYQPLYYAMETNKQASPNVSAVAGIGEGVGGFLAQRLYHCSKLARPNHDFPDIVMESGDDIFLVESKASMTDAKSMINSVLPRMAAFTSSCAQLDSRPMIGLLIGTTVVSQTAYKCHIAEVTLG